MRSSDAGVWMSWRFSGLLGDDGPLVNSFEVRIIRSGGENLARCVLSEGNEGELKASS